jgi:CRP/FNR family transcriptional regulator, cyclic AMP receptor protein
MAGRTGHSGTHGEIPVDAFLTTLPTAERALLEGAGHVRHFAARTAIMHEGDPSDHVLVILRGCVKVVASAADGAKLILGIRGPGDVVGELASLDGRPRRGTVLTIDRVEALVVAGDRFTRLLDERPAITRAVNRTLSERLAEADRHRLAAGSGAVAAALARLLLDLAARYGGPTAGGGLNLGVALTQRDLAECLAVSPRTVARTLASWRRNAVVTTDRRHIVIRQPAALKAHARTAI